MTELTDAEAEAALRQMVKDAAAREHLAVLRLAATADRLMECFYSRLDKDNGTTKL